VADDIRELNALIADYGREFQSPDLRSGPSLGSSRLYADYQPATSSEQAEMLLSLLPGIGEGLDVANLVQDLENREYGQAGLSGLAMVLPGVGAGTVKQAAKKLKADKPTRRPDGSYRYKEFDIVKDGKEYRFSHPSDEGYELSADTLDDAQTQIDDIFEETFGEVLSDEKATGWLKNHGYDPYVGIGPRPKTPYYEFTEDGAIKAYTPYGGNKSGVEVKTFRNPTRKQLRDWMGYKSGGRVERNPYNHEPKAI
jgi:hypothetical protein